MAGDHFSLVHFINVLYVAMTFITGVRGMFAQESNLWETDRLCGRLQHVERIPDRELENVFSDRRHGLRHLSLALYEQQNSLACCDGLSAMETVTTGKGGRFEFKTKNRREFWLVTNWNNQEYRPPVVYQPHKELFNHVFRSKELSFMTTEVLIHG